MRRLRGRCLVCRPHRGTCASARPGSRSSSSKRATASAAGSGREPLADGSTVDRGGAWLGPKHDAILGLASEVGVDHLQDVGEGRAPADRRGTHAPLHRAHPEDQPARGADARARAAGRSTGWRRRVPLDAPWTAPRAAEWDARSVASLARAFAGSARRSRRDLFESALRGLMTADLVRGVAAPSAVSGARAREHRHAVLDRERRTGEPRERRRRLDRAAGRRRSSVSRLGSTRRCARSRQRDDRVVVAGDAARGLGATTPWCRFRRRSRSRSRSIRRCPRIARRSTATRSAARRPRRSSCTTSRSGAPTATAARSAEPGSRRRAHDRREPPVRQSGHHGGVRVRADRRARRRRSTPACGARPCSTRSPRASARARRKPAEFIETSWWNEEWSRGCSMAHFTPGTLTRYGHSAAASRSDACTGPAPRRRPISHGAIDGAVRSGERAAAEILERS